MSESGNEKNPHIDFTKSNENIYFVQKDIKDFYEKEFGEALEKYNAKQKRSDRKIDNYYKHIQKSRKHVTQHEMILQIGDRDDFSNKENKNLANEVLTEWYEDFEKRNPNIKVYNAVIHNDEASPHMHLNFVPVADGYKRGLEKQVSFDRALLQQDKTLTNERPFEQWREKEVLLLEKKLLERGIDRKLVGTNEYKDVTEYKQKKDELREIENEIKSLQVILPDTKEQIPFLKKEIEKDVRSKLIGKPEIIEKETENYVLTPKQYNDLTEKVHAAVSIQKDYARLKNTDLAKENVDLKKSFEAEIINRLGSENENNHLKKENKDLISVNATLKSHISDLRQEIGLIYKSTKEYIKEHTESVRSFKQVFSSLVDKVREKTNEGEFNRVYKRELRKERNNDLER